MSTEQYRISIGQDRVNAIFTDAMGRMYGLVALGIVTTGVAIWVGDMLGVGNIIFGFRLDWDASHAWDHDSER